MVEVDNVTPSSEHSSGERWPALPSSSLGCLHPPEVDFTKTGGQEVPMMVSNHNQRCLDPPHGTVPTPARSSRTSSGLECMHQFGPKAAGHRFLLLMALFFKRL